MFTSGDIERHQKSQILLGPMKKSWPEYKKLFIKESRIVGAKFYSENKKLIMRVSEKYNVDPFIILSIAGSKVIMEDIIRVYRI